MAAARQFRTDINGLRALAVIAVVWFHFYPSSFPGGFVGVDIFFVISGYLMTQIIVTRLEKNTFSFRDFFKSRFLRIVPALTFLCFILLIFGWFNLLNIEYHKLSKHIFDSLLFYSNHTYWQEAGYFDASSHEKWLLHTWSLSVEWQFYIIYPFILVILYKLFTQRFLFIPILIGIFLSLSLSIYAAKLWPDAAYFLIVTRAWQMLVGALAFLIPIQIFSSNARQFSLFGGVILLVTFFIVNTETPWPGTLSILPVMSTYIILQSKITDSVWLGNSVSQALGKWSYSIYLWHWPVVVFVNNLPFQPSTAQLLAAVFISILLGALSFRFIEKGKNLIYSSIAFLSVLGLTIVIIENGGAKTELRTMSALPANEVVEKYLNYERNLQPCMVSAHFRNHGSYDLPKRCLDMDSEGGIFLWGDSHMQALAPGILEHFNDTVINQVYSSGCPASFTVKQGDASPLRRACDQSNQIALSAIKRIRPDIVIMAAKHNHENMDWQESAKTLKSEGVKAVILVGPVPQWYPSLPLVYSKYHMGKDVISTEKLDKNIVRTNKRLQSILPIPEIIFIDVLGNLCDDAYNKCTVKINGSLMSFDYGHLTNEGASFVTKEYIKPVIATVLSSQSVDPQKSSYE